MRPEQLDLFLDIVPSKAKRRKLKHPAEILAFPMSAHVGVRQMAGVMSAMPAKERNPFWRLHARRLINERIDAGLTPEAARKTVLDYTAAVRRLTRYLDADPVRSGRPSGSGA